MCEANVQLVASVALGAGNVLKGNFIADTCIFPYWPTLTHDHVGLLTIVYGCGKVWVTSGDWHLLTQFVDF